MKNLMNFAAQQLSKSDMLHISGGIDRDEYCRNLDEMWTDNVDNWDPGAIEGWWIGWNEHCA